MHIETLGLDIRLSQSSVRSAPYRLIDTSDISHLLPRFITPDASTQFPPQCSRQHCNSLLGVLSFFVSLTSSTYSL